MTEGIGARDMRLIDGKRVQVKNLIDAGVLAVESILTFDRPRLGEFYEAVVTAEGRLRLPDGREFAAPSRAAMEAADANGIDGWSAWVSGDSTLADLRQQLLADAAGQGGGDDSDDSMNVVRSRREALAEMRELADAGQPQSLSVRGLIELWGSERRGQRVIDRVLADLENHGLTTEPDFRKVSIDSVVAVVGPPPEDEDEEAESKAPVDVELNNEASRLDVGLTLGNLPSASGGVLSVKPGDSIEKAMTEMRLNDYSQLPVMTSTREIKGSVTWRTCLLYTSPSPRDLSTSRMPSSA